MDKLTYDADMYRHLTCSQPSPPPRGCRPQADIPAIVSRDHTAGHRAMPSQVPTRTQRGESPMKDFDPAPELADLRRGWGDVYRITWNGDRFRATHIVSGQAVDAGSAADLRMLIRDYHSRCDRF